MKALARMETTLIEAKSLLRESFQRDLKFVESRELTSFKSVC